MDLVRREEVVDTEVFWRWVTRVGFMLVWVRGGIERREGGGRECDRQKGKVFRKDLLTKPWTVLCEEEEEGREEEGERRDGGGRRDAFWCERLSRFYVVRWCLPAALCAELPPLHFFTFHFLFFRLSSSHSNFSQPLLHQQLTSRSSQPSRSHSSVHLTFRFQIKRPPFPRPLS